MTKRAAIIAAAVLVWWAPSGATLTGAWSAEQVWPSFRGLNASGVSDEQDLPASWNAATGENIRWKKQIPGLAHSSPIVSAGRVFVTSAVSSRSDATFKPGLYGEGTASEDRSVHKWIVLAVGILMIATAIAVVWRPIIDDLWRPSIDDNDKQP